MYENNYPNNYHYESGNVYQNTQASAGAGSQPQKQAQKKKSGSGAGKKILIAICCGLCFGIFGGLGFQAVDAAADILKSAVGFEAEREESTKTEEAVEESVPEEAQEDEQIAQVSSADVISATVTDVTEVVQNVMPSVVSINNKYIEKTSFFGQEYSREAEGAGSGIIVGKNETELLLVSNYHVVEAAEELTVQFIDGSQVQAQIKGTDADKDLAVIAVQLEDIEIETMDEIAIAKLGDSTALTVGEPVIAIGNALGYGQSVTTGVVSALNRPIYVEETSMDMYTQEDQEINTFIQTDAAINPGNSGGALLNIRGEVIGINSNKIGGDAIEGMGYAIPISDAYPIIEDLMSKETRLKVDEEKKGYLGITGVNVYQEYAQIYGVPEGVYVSSVMEGTGAEAAGLQIGDIIIALNEEEVSSMDELKDELAYYEEGTTVNLTIMRAGTLGYETIVVEITLGAQQTIE